MIQGGYITEHDGLVARKLGHILAGGELSQGPGWTSSTSLTWSAKPSSAWWARRRRRMRVMGFDAKTQRAQMLQSGKPVRN
jgi:hypothetical protein